MAARCSAVVCLPASHSSLFRNVARSAHFLFALCLLATPLLARAEAPSTQQATPTDSHDASHDASRRAAPAVRPSLAFEPNVGQSASTAKYLAHGRGFAVELRPDTATLEFETPHAAAKPNSEPNPRPATHPIPENSQAKSWAVTMQLVGGAPQSQLGASEKLPGTSSYFPTSDVKTWHANVPTYGRVNYGAVYPGIDLSFYGRDSRLEYDFTLAPGADAHAIRLRLSGMDGASIDSKGELQMRGDQSTATFLKPVAYQLLADGKTRQMIDVQYGLDKATQSGTADVTFTIGKYDPARPLVIDPVLTYAEYLPYAASYNYYAAGVKVDSAGNTYELTSGPGSGGFAVIKVDPSGNVLNNISVGSSMDGEAYSLALDASNNMYVTGYASQNLPTTSGAYQPADNASTEDAFLSVLNANGSGLLYSSYLGGSSNDLGYAVAVDSSGNAYITGYTQSADFPTTSGVYQATDPKANTGYYTGWVAKFNPTASGAASLVYSTYLSSASNGYDYLYAIAVDTSGDAFLTGSLLPGFPVTSGAYNYSTTGGFPGNSMAYVVKLNPAATALLYSAQLGPGTGYGIAIDSSGASYVTGLSTTDDYPTTSGAYQVQYPGPFATKLSADGTTLAYSTYLGGLSSANIGNDPATSIALPPGCASNCVATIAGYTYTLDFPAINAIDSTPSSNGNANAFLVQLAANGASATLSSYFAAITGYVSQSGYYGTPAVTVDSSGDILLAFSAVGTEDFPYTSPIGPSNPYDYLAKISPSTASFSLFTPPTVSVGSYYVGETGASTTITTLRNLGSKAIGSLSLSISDPEFTETDNCGTAIAAGAQCTIKFSLTPDGTGTRTGTLTATSDAPNSPVTVALSGYGYDSAYLQFSATQLSFGDQALNTTSATQNITVTNVGSEPVTLNTPFYTNSNPANEFTVLSTCPGTLNPGASCTIGVTFTPIQAGLQTTTIYSNYPGSSLTATGSGIASTGSGSLALPYDIVNFGTAVVGATTGLPTTYIYAYNTGSVPVTVNNLSLAKSGSTDYTKDFILSGSNCVNFYSATNQTPNSVDGQANCYIYIQFSPSTTNTETVTLNIANSTSTTPLTATLMGTGIAAVQTLEFSPSNLVFDDQPVGFQSGQMTVSVSNQGTTPFVIDRIIASPPFTVTYQSCSTLAPAGSSNFNCEFQVNFTPTTTGAQTGTVTVYDTAGNAQVLSVAGTGITSTGSLSLENNALTFAPQATGTTSSYQILTAVNTGNSPVTINTVTFTGDFNGLYSNSCVATVVQPASSCAIYVEFTPTKTSGSESGSVTLASTAGNLTANFTGTAEAATQAIGFTPTSISFGNIQTGTSDGTVGYHPKVFVRNTGTETVTFNASPTVSTNFTITGNNCGGQGNTLAPNASCEIDVEFTAPSATGAVNGTLTLTDTAGSGTQSIPLSGTAVSASPSVLIQPAELAFNQQALGSDSGPSNQYVYLVNTTATAINITSTTATGDFYIQSGYNECASNGLGANSNCYSYVGFKPTVTGYRTGTLTFTDSNNNKYVVPLAGYAPGEMNQATLTPDSLVFADQVAGVASSSITPDGTQYAYIYNYGNLPLTVGTLTPTSTTDFTIGYDECSNTTVQPNGSYCYVSFTFTPTGTGHKTGTVTFPVTFQDNSTQTLTLALSGNGISPNEHATLTPTKVTYLDQVAGTSYPASGTQYPFRLAFTNDGNISLTVGQFSLSDTTDFSTTATYAYDQCSGVVLTPGNSCAIGILFTPSATVGTKSGTGTLPFHYNDSGSTTGSIGITLSGKAIAANNTVYLTPTVSQLPVEVINTEDTNEYTNFYVTNNGNSPVTLGQASLTANFTNLYDQCSGITLQPTQQCLERVAFTPTSTSSSYSTTKYTGTLSIPVTGGTTLTAALSGTGIPTSQTLVLSQPTLNFGSVNVGGTSAQLSAELVNQGPSNSNIVVSSVVLGGTNASDFTLNSYDNYCITTIYGRQTCTLYATFNPAASSTGTRTATVTVYYGTGQTLVLNLTGNGTNPIPQATVYPTTLNFGSQGVGATSATQSFSVTNTGSANLVIGTLTFNNSTVFPVQYNNCSGATLAPQSSCQVGIAFDPGASGSASGSASIPSNATTQSVSFTGTGTGGPVVSLTPGSLTFSSQAISSTSPSQSIVVKNTGGATLTSLSISIQGTNSGDFAQSSNCTSTLASGSSCTVNVTFDPTAVGTRTAELYLTDNASGSPQTAMLTGTGAQQSQTISFTAPSSTTYGAAPFTLNATASSGLPVTFAITSGPATVSGSTLTITGAGTVKVTASQAGNANYAPATSVTQTFTVSPAPLTVTATSTSRAYGAANPTFTYAITGFQYSDTSSVVSGSATETTTATSTSSPGTYPITFATENLTASNYTFSYVSGTLTVTAGVAATPVITPGTGSYTAGQYVTITDTTPNSTIYYTLNNTTPTTNSTPYTGQIYVSSNETIEAAAIATGYTLSNPATATYTFIPATTNPTSLAFGSQANESTSSAKTVTVTNPGANSLSGFTPSFSGANASDFAVLSNGACGGTVAAGGNCVLSITFTPHGTGARSATLNISYSGIGSPLSVGLSGTGTALTPSLTLTPSSNSVTYGQSLSVTASLSGNPSPTGTVSYVLDSGSIQTATLSGGSVNFSLGVLASGTHSLAATYNGDSVYGTTTQTLNFTVAKATLTATAASLSRQYGAANPTLTYAITGFVNSDTSAVVSGSATLTTTATSTSPVGTYPITFATESLTATNYTITYVAGTLTVSGGATQTITFGALANQTYGVSPITLTATASSGLPVTYTVTGPATVSGSTLTITGAGSVTVTASQAGNSNYAAAPNVSQSFTVAKATLTATATNLSRAYGAANPTLTYAITGFVNSDTSAVVSGSATLTTTATSTSPVGTYPITFATESLTATNYTITYVAGTLTVSGGATQTITFGALANQTYGVSPITLTATASSGLPVTYTVTGPATVSGSTLTITGAGSVTVTASQAGNSNYAAAPNVSQSFTVAKATLTATAASQSRQYGAANPTLTYAITGFVNSDTSAVVSGSATLTTTATSTSPVGTYPITFATESLTATNYTITYVAGTLTVSGGATQTITFGALANQTYGVSPITLTATASSGLPVTYTVTGPATVSGSTLTITGAGSVTVTASQAGNSNYAAAPNVSQSFTVAKATLTATATNLSRAYGAANPTLTYAITGFVNSDTSAVVSGSATLTTTATSTSPVGTYPITFATENLAATNYTITYVAGTLTVSGGATQTITFGALANQTYGVSPITLTATASSGLPVTYTVTGPATVSGSTLTITGAGSVTVTASQAGNSNYAAAPNVSQSFTVAKATLTATAASLSRQYGAANPTLTYAITGFVNSDTSAVVSGSATLTTTATSTSPVGTYPITFATESLTATNYTITYVAGTLTITAATGQCTTINYANGFTSTGLTLNGGASVKNNLLQLTDGGFFEARSAFYSTAVPVNGFTTDFTFQVLLPLADGFTFVIQSNNPQEVGQSGGGLGYAGIPNSVAVKFDLFNNAGEGFDSVGAYVDGAYPTQPSINLSNTGIQLHSGHIFAVHIAFANAMTTATITDTQTNATYSMSAPGDLTQVLGQKAYIGFTGGTGALTSIQNILTWSYEGGTGCGN